MKDKLLEAVNLVLERAVAWRNGDDDYEGTYLTEAVDKYLDVSTEYLASGRLDGN